MHLKHQEELEVDGYTWIGNNRNGLHVNAIYAVRVMLVF